MIELLNSTAAFLQTNGGWGVAAICMVALYKKDKQFGEKLDERHEEFLALLRETTEMLTCVRNTLQSCSDRNRGDRRGSGRDGSDQDVQNH